MLRNYIATALRNARRAPLYFATNVIGLTVGFMAALFAALFVRFELTYNHWIPDHERIYTVATSAAPMPDAEPIEWTYAYRDTARWLALDFPEVEAAGRMRSQSEVVVTRGEVREPDSGVAAADPNFFSVMAFPAIAGDPASALSAPDSIVVTRTFARKHFGQDTPMGETIGIDGHLLRVTAVLEDVPGNNWFPGGIGVQAFISAAAPFSVLAQWDAQGFGPETERGLMMWGGTYVRLRPGVTAADLDQRLAEFTERRMPKALLGETSLRILPIGAMNPPPYKNPAFATLRERFYANVFGVAGIGLLVLLGASINYVNAVTGRAVRRATEVGVRKASGALRLDLVLQFIGEGVIISLLAMALALSVFAALLPAISGYIDRDLFIHSLSGWHILAVFTAVGVVGAVSGLYPAVVLASLSPSAAFRTANPMGRGRFGLREALVVVQFAIFIAIAVITLTVYRQSHFAAQQTAGFATERVLMVKSGCLDPFIAALRNLPGIEAVTCGDSYSSSYGSVTVGPNGPERLSGIFFKAVDGDYFRVFDLKLLAGRTLTSDTDSAGVVINETAARRMGFATPQEAIGKTMSWRRIQTWGKAPDIDMVTPIVGVVGDTVTSVIYPPGAAAYYADVSYLRQAIAEPFNRATIKLTGQDIPGTLRAFDETAARMQTERPIRRQFADQWIETLYADLTRQVRAVTLITGVSFFVAIIGLVGLSAAVAERKLKEVGIRKAMGANRKQILALMLSQFCRPVLLANLLAWPAAYLAAGRWLEGFSKHVDIAAWTFLAASVGIAAIAAFTVLGHALSVARAQPVRALRYE
ncbi:MAG: ABC transporter permease [Rhodospirillaceae bacterium]